MGSARDAPGQNGVRERAFGSLKYQHLDRYEITNGPDAAREAEEYQQIFNWIRPHEALQMARPGEIYCNQHTPSDNIPTITQTESELLPDS